MSSLTSPSPVPSFSPPSKQHRAFILAYHRTHGILLLLHPGKKGKKKKGGVRKGSKPPYYQYPGGKVDPGDYEGLNEGVCKTLVRYYYLGARRGALREFKEETGIDVEEERIRGAKMLYAPTDGSKPYLTHEFKSRFFFTLELSDSDFHILKGDSISDASLHNVGVKGCSIPPVKVKEDEDVSTSPLHNGNGVAVKVDGRVSPHDIDDGPPSPSKSVHRKKAAPLTPTGESAMTLGLRLSSEHIAFTFVEDLLIASGLVKLHSGGVCSEASIMIMKGKGFKGETKVMCGGGEREEEEEDISRYRYGYGGDDDEEEEAEEYYGVGGVGGGRGGYGEVCCGWTRGGGNWCGEEEEWKEVKAIGTIPRVPEKPKGGFKREDKHVLK